MADDEDLTKDAMFMEAVAVYTEHYAMDTAALARQPDRRLSRITTGREATVILMDTKGVPIGTVIWSVEGKPFFEPPTRITLVDHLGLRPTKE
jgi:hypothetical protein